jgi:polyhydroxybutyrate depolymerase
MMFRGLVKRSGALCLLILGLASALPLASPAAACSDVSPCDVDGGSYFARPPAGWDGKSLLPVVFYFHGHSDSAAVTMADPYMKKSLDDAGILLVAMDGENRSWSFPAKLTGSRDDVRYTAAVLADVKKRFSVDTSLLLASGFSVGGSMVWYVACSLGNAFSGYAPMSGSYWEPMPTDCPGGPVALRHIHGTADRTVPLEGRSLRSGQFKQGDSNESFRRLLARNGCSSQPDHVSTRDVLTCRTWSAGSCSGGKGAEFCLHDGGHRIESQWIVDGMNWLRAQRPATANR